MLDEEMLHILKRFEVDPNIGFLFPDPLTRLPATFEPWHQVIDELPELIEANLLEDRIQKLPLISADTLTTQRELRLAHLLLGTLAAAHVWEHGSDKARLSIPANISIPLLDISGRLGFKPIASHASACLANWKPERVTAAIFDAATTDIIAFRFTRHPGNRWFFTLTAQIEVELAPALCAVTSACLHGKVEQTTMKGIQDAVMKATNSIQRMDEHLPPEVFYDGFRRFLSGYTQKALAKQGGIIFEGRENLGPQPLTGGSAAQSSTFHVLDGFLQIKHTGDVQSFLDHQREYMPPKHRSFILWVRENAAKISDLQHCAGYQEAVLAVRRFREEHMNVVTKFIVLPSKCSTGQGTGGSSFMRLLLNAASDCDL